MKNPIQTTEPNYTLTQTCGIPLEKSEIFTLYGAKSATTLVVIAVSKE